MQTAHSANDLLDGPLSRGLVKLAGPMFVSAMLQNAQSLIDLFWVGRLGSSAVAALAVSGAVLMALFPVVMGMSTGTVAIVSRAVGAGRYDEASRAGGQSLLAALLFGLLAGSVGFFFAAPLCRLLGAEEDVVRIGAPYLQVSFLGSFTVFLLFIANSILQSAGDAVVPMCAMLLANALNMVLDPIMIFGLLGLPPMGVQGAALATVLAQAAAVVLVLAVLHRGHGGVRVTLGAWRLHGALLWRLARIGVPSSGQMLSRSLMTMVLMRVVAGCGTAAVAAYGIGVRFHMIVLMPAFTLGNAAATLVGQNLGAGRPDRSQRAAWLATGMDVLIMLASAAALMLFAAPLIRIFNTHDEVVRIGSDYLRTVSPFYVFAALSIVLGRALQGAGETVAPMVTTIVSLWVVQVPLAVYLAQRFEPATRGIWYSIAATLVVNGLMVAACFHQGRWKNRKV